MTQEEALRKAMACLRLAKSSNPNEAALAAAKAQEIMDRHGLSISDADFDTREDKHDAEPVTDFGDDPVDRTNKYDGWWALRLISTLASHNACKAYYTSLGDAGRILKVVGRPSDVATVRYLYSLLKSEVKRLQAENCTGRSGVYKYQYGLGVVDTIATRLAEQRRKTVAEVKQEQSGNGLALVRVNNALAKQERRLSDVQKFMDEKMKLKSSTSRGTGWNGMEARAKGRRDGHGVRMGAAKAGLGSTRQQLN